MQTSPFSKSTDLTVGMSRVSVAITKPRLSSASLKRKGKSLLLCLGTGVHPYDLNWRKPKHSSSNQTTAVQPLQHLSLLANVVSYQKGNKGKDESLESGDI